MDQNLNDKVQIWQEKLYSQCVTFKWSQVHYVNTKIKKRDRGQGSKGREKEESASQKGGGIQKGERSTS